MRKIILISIFIFSLTSGLYFFAQHTNAAWFQHQSGLNSTTRTWVEIKYAENGTRVFAVGNSNDGRKYLFRSTVNDPSSEYTVNTLSWATIFDFGVNTINDISVSSNGQSLIVADSEYVRVSNDSGVSFTAESNIGVANWTAVAISGDATKYLAGRNGAVYRKYDGGAWVLINSTVTVTSLAMSQNGNVIAIGTESGNVLISYDAGNTWSTIDVSDYSINDITISKNGTRIAVSSGSSVYTSVDSGETWSTYTYSSPSFVAPPAITSSPDGSKIYAAYRNIENSEGVVMVSTDSGETWQIDEDMPNRNWKSITSAMSGTRIAAVALNDQYVYGKSVPDSTQLQLLEITTDTPDGTYIVGDTIDITFIFSKEVTFIDISGTDMVIEFDTGVFRTQTCGLEASTSQKYLIGQQDTHYVCELTIEPGSFATDLTVSNIINRGDTPIMLNAFTNLNDAHDISVNGNQYPWAQTSSGNRDWRHIAASDNGQRIVAIAGNYLYASENYGVWQRIDSAGQRNWSDIAISDSGTMLVATVRNGYVYTSTDAGVTWLEQDSLGVGPWEQVTISSSGEYIFVAGSPEKIYVSTDGGETWDEVYGTAKTWTDLEVSSNGTVLIASTINESVGNSSGNIYFSTDAGVTWSTAVIGGVGDTWSAVDVSVDGSKMIAVSHEGSIYISSDSAGTWIEKTIALSEPKKDVVLDSGGLSVGVLSETHIYISNDFGETWTQQIDSDVLSDSWGAITSTNGGIYVFAASQSGYIYGSNLESLDTTPPTITSVSSDKANGTYTVGEVIDIDVTFSEVVTSTGNVTVILETGATDRTCTFTITDDDTGTCDYTVQAGDTNSDLTVSSISGTITDQAANALSDFSIDTNLAVNKALVIDAIAPSVSLTTPSNSATVSGSAVTISADVSDNTAVAGVTFKRNTNTVIGSEDTTAPYSITWDTTALPDGTQTLIAVARDTAGNYATSSAITVTVSNDSTPPTRSAGTPSTEQPSGTTDVTLSLTTDEDATCKYGTVANTAYASIVNTMETTGGTTHTHAITGLSDNATYTYYIRCIDTNANANTDDYTISFSVAVEESNPGSEGGGSSGSTQSYRRDATTDTTGDTRVSTTTATTTTTTTTTPADTTTPDITTTITRVDTILTTIRSLLADPTPDVVTLTELIAELKTIFATLETNTPTDTTPTTTTFTTDLSLGMNHPDVQLLQQFLNRTSFIVASQGAGSVGRETTFFGYATEAALIQFQRFYNITPAIGFFGAVTRGVVNGLERY